MFNKIYIAFLSLLTGSFPSLFLLPVFERKKITSAITAISAINETTHKRFKDKKQNGASTIHQL